MGVGREGCVYVCMCVGVCGYVCVCVSGCLCVCEVSPAVVQQVRRQDRYTDVLPVHGVQHTGQGVDAGCQLGHNTSQSIPIT